MADPLLPRYISPLLVLGNLYGAEKSRTGLWEHGPPGGNNIVKLFPCTQDPQTKLVRINGTDLKPSVCNEKMLATLSNLGVRPVV